MARNEVVIVLSAYNGARHIEEQIGSIQRQRLRDWVLLVRDDGSSDGTPALVGALAREDSRIRLVPSSGKNLGAVASFGALLAEAATLDPRWVFLADQDDVWVEEKLDRQLDAMVRAEERLGPEVPILVHSDLGVVDDRLQPIHRSFLRYQSGLATPAGLTLHTLLAQNLVTGAATAVNRALLRVALPLPDVVMHDWWLAQCAAAAGAVVSLPDALVLYRQHAANVVGARGFYGIVSCALRSPRQWWKRGGRNFVNGVRQVGMLRERLGRESGSRGADLTAHYEAVFTEGATPVQRLRRVLCLGVQPASWVPRLLFYLRVLLYDRLRKRSEARS
jgi:glycosyltransferase involved in cell wall biosynthesis